MVDISKIKPGDEVTVRAKVIRAFYNSSVGWIQADVGIDVPQMIGTSCILTHTPNPREFKVRDMVRHLSDDSEYEIVGIREGKAAVWRPDGGPYEGHWAIWNLCDLSHADDLA